MCVVVMFVLHEWRDARCGWRGRALDATVVDRVPWIDSPEGHVPSIPFEAPLDHPLISREACLVRFPSALAWMRCARCLLGGPVRHCWSASGAAGCTAVAPFLVPRRGVVNAVDARMLLLLMGSTVARRRWSRR